MPSRAAIVKLGIIAVRITGSLLETLPVPIIDLIDRSGYQRGNVTMSTILIIILVILLLGGFGGYHGYSRYGGPALGGVLGLVLIVIIVLWLVGGVHV